MYIRIHTLTMVVASTGVCLYDSGLLRHHRKNTFLRYLYMCARHRFKTFVLRTAHSHVVDSTSARHSSVQHTDTH